MIYNGKKFWMGCSSGETKYRLRLRTENSSKVMGIVDGNIPYGGYDTFFIPLEMLNTITPVENLNYQLIIDTADNGMGYCKDQLVIVNT